MDNMCSVVFVADSADIYRQKLIQQRMKYPAVLESIANGALVFKYAHVVRV